MSTDMKYYGIIVAGGSGNRMQSEVPKQFLPLADYPIVMHTLSKFKQALPQIELILVLPEGQFSYWQQLVKQHHFTLPHQLVAGGASRFQSVSQGLGLIKEPGVVAIHDGVRPLVSKKVIRHSFEQAQLHGNAITSVPLKDSIRQISAHGTSQAVDRSLFRLIQTPQTFTTELILSAYQTAERDFFTDDASVAEYAGATIHLMEGEYTNIKITTPEDLIFAENWLNRRK
ncbi:2-C-methyl-D-erythritol 4-phosphate cytidylyltransferase [Rapidithrix thailandica]|uniref:2-C-methyl-D-erythritol 4-phosphate cytidylyltransferase n=1 Tax=Rapidithrix thailandica TaxID=413964 RepID=A0AAW9S2Z3_9BACT